MHILVLEASTTSAKAMLYNTDNHSYKVKTKMYENNYKDITLHDAENVFQSMTSLAKEMINGNKIDMISLVGTWHSLVLCDRNMSPVTPVYLWSNTEASMICKELRKDNEYVKKYYHKTGCMVNAIYPSFKLQMLRERGALLKDYYVMGQGTYNTYKLTGERVITECLASGTGLLNIHNKKFDKDILKEIGIEEEQLSRLVNYNDVFPLSIEGANLLGIEPGIPVIPTNSDGGLNQVGVGALEEGVMTFSVGTSGAIRLTSDKPIIPNEPSTWCYLSPKSWLSGAATSGCCNCIDWFKNNFFSKEISYEEIENGVSDFDSYPIFLPFLFGERCPGWDDERRGGFIDILPYHKPNDLYRGVQEGVLFNLYHCYTTLIKLNGTPKRVKLSGGILNSPQWTQMCADIFNIPMEIDEVEHGSLIGGAALAMEILGLIGDVAEYKADSVKVINPNIEMNNKYMKRFKRYLELYQNNSN